jgi:hypothetical protein
MQGLQIYSLLITLRIINMIAPLRNCFLLFAKVATADNSIVAACFDCSFQQKEYTALNSTHEAKKDA